MPELPEVETVMRGLRPVLAGAVIVRVETRRPDLRFPFPPGFARRLTGRRIEAVSRRAKYMLADLDDGGVLILHLGMTGRFVVERAAGTLSPGEFYYDTARDPVHDHVVFHLGDGTRVTYNDPRRFGFMDLAERAALEQHRSFRDLGIEPLGNALDGDVLATLFADRTTSLKAALMDQRLIAGLGNIYVCEALFGAGLHPEREAGSIDADEARRLADEIRRVLGKAVDLGGSTISDFVAANGAEGGFQDDFFVYDRAGEPCRVCATPIARLVQANRSTFLCPTCQPGPRRRRARAGG